MFTSIKKSISSVYLLYELNTCIYMLDPWEKKFISILFQQKPLRLIYAFGKSQVFLTSQNLLDGVIFSILALLIFSSYVYLPSYTRKLINAFMPSGNEITLDLMDHHHQQPVDYGVNWAELYSTPAAENKQVFTQQFILQEQTIPISEATKKKYLAFTQIGRSYSITVGTIMAIRGSLVCEKRRS